MRNVATILPLKSKSFGKSHYFNAIDRSIKMLIFDRSIKKISKDEILNHLYFGPNFVFLGIALGRFS